MRKIVVRMADGQWLHLTPSETECRNCDGGQCMDCVMRMIHDDCYQDLCPTCGGSGIVETLELHPSYFTMDDLTRNEVPNVHFY